MTEHRHPGGDFIDQLGQHIGTTLSATFEMLEAIGYTVDKNNSYAAVHGLPQSIRYFNGLGNEVYLSTDGGATYILDIAHRVDDDLGLANESSVRDRDIIKFDGQQLQWTKQRHILIIPEDDNGFNLATAEKTCPLQPEKLLHLVTKNQPDNVAAQLTAPSWDNVLDYWLPLRSVPAIDLGWDWHEIPDVPRVIKHKILHPDSPDPINFFSREGKYIMSLPEADIIPPNEQS